MTKHHGYKPFMYAILAALWGGDHGVVSVSVAIDGDNSYGTMTPLKAWKNPQHILALDDGSALVSHFATGTIYRVRKAT